MFTPQSTIKTQHSVKKSVGARSISGVAVWRSLQTWYGRPSGAALTFATQRQLREANVKSKAPLAPMISSGPLILTFAKEHAEKECEC